MTLNDEKSLKSKEQISNINKSQKSRSKTNLTNLNLNSVVLPEDGAANQLDSQRFNESLLNLENCDEELSKILRITWKGINI